MHAAGIERLISADPVAHLYSEANMQQSQQQQQVNQQQQQQQESPTSNICVNLSQWAIEHACSSINSISTKQDSDKFSISQLAPLHIGTRHIQHDEQMMFASNSSSPLTQLVGDHLLGPTSQLEAKLNYYVSDIWLTSGDERSNRLPFIGAGPWKLLFATLIYLYLIKRLLPLIMRPLRPLELQWPIRAYNLAMVVSNLWAFWHGARILHFGGKCFGCETINHQDYSEQAIELLHYGWLFFLSRLVEWLDTIFFVLRKKDRQVTKLHVFHHSFVPLISWTYLKYHPGYTVAFFPFVNSFVHSIMYTYYLLATFGPKVQPYLWWKRYLTSLQIAQFVLIIIQLASIPLTGDETCQYPRGFFYVALAGACLFLWLFFTYYLDTYSSSNKQQKGLTNQQVNGRKTSGSRQLNANDQREGSSRALSDAIDNAILGYDDEEVDVKLGSNTNSAARNRKSQRIV